MNQTCDCSEDYGPCENHSEVLAQREGASARTADDLAYVFLTDVLAIAEDHDPNTADVARLNSLVDYWGDDALWEDNMGVRWLDVNRDETLPEPLQDHVQLAEHMLADLGLSVWWEDGYVISRVTGGPLS